MEKFFRCPKCGHEFRTEVNPLRDPNRAGLTGMILGATAGFLVGGPGGALIGAATCGKWGKRTPTLWASICCPKCGCSVDV